jgi:high-affinity Fe2+/Pb2+ permease
VVWISLFAGAILTVAFTLFFGSENLPAQMLMTGVLTALVMLGLVVIISIDHPFTGAVRIDAAPIEQVLADFWRP